MRDAPMQAYRKKKDSSMHVAARLVKSGDAQALVTRGKYRRGDGGGAIFAGDAAIGGSTGAGGAISHRAGGTSVLLDVGANVDSRPQHLVQFAVMGENYYRAIFGTQAAASGAAEHRRRRNEGQ